VRTEIAEHPTVSVVKNDEISCTPVPMEYVLNWLEHRLVEPLWRREADAMHIEEDKGVEEGAVEALLGL
jgi:hypothetical protein